MTVPYADLELHPAEPEPPSEHRTMCRCDIGKDVMPHERHDEDCPFRVAMERILHDGYPA